MTTDQDSVRCGLALLASLLTACGGGGGNSDSSPPPAATHQLVAMTVAGHPHAVNVYRVAGATRAVVLLHGGGGNLNAVAYQVGLNASASVTSASTINWAWLAANQVTLVVPQGQHIASNPGATTWSNHAMTSGQDDKAFLQALAAQVRSEYGLADITLMGHSMGGVMTNRMWCESPATFNRYVSLAGPASAAFQQPGTPCAPGSAAAPYMGIMGDRDSVIQTTGAWDAATWQLSPPVVASSTAAWVNTVVIGELQQQRTRTTLVCGELLDSDGFTTSGNVDTWTSCAGRLLLRRVRGGDHGVASLDALMGAGANDVMDAVMAFTAAR